MSHKIDVEHDIKRHAWDVNKSTAFQFSIHDSCDIRIPFLMFGYCISGDTDGKMAHWHKVVTL